jgi:hypothetical protein
MSSKEKTLFAAPPKHASQVTGEKTGTGKKSREEL